MAELIRDEHGLVGLRVGYRERSRGTPVVTCVLDSPDHPSQSWDIPAAQVNLPITSERVDQHVDAGVNLGPVRSLLAPTSAVSDLRAGHTPLWLNLTSEHVLLAALGWESGLADLDVPVLRLPVHLAPPAPRPARPRVALWVTMPVAKSPYPAEAMVQGALDGIAGAMGRLPEVHLFADAALTPELQARFGGQMTVHDPTAEGPHEPTPRGSTSTRGVEDQPWLAWIARTLGDRSFDVLHLIGHGCLSVDQGGFACAEAPDRNFDTRTARFVWPQQLCALLATTGTWGVVFTAVPENYSRAALRLLAARTAGLRAAATVFHDSAEIGPGGGLADAYRLLLRHPTQPPASTSGLAITAHPARFGIEQVRPGFRPERTELATLVESGAEVSGALVGAQRQIAELEAQLTFESSAPRVDSTRAGLELAKSRLDAILRDTGQLGEPS
jgi:hypothetical protein